LREGVRRVSDEAATVLTRRLSHLASVGQVVPIDFDLMRLPRATAGLPLGGPRLGSVAAIAGRSCGRGPDAGRRAARYSTLTLPGRYRPMPSVVGPYEATFAPDQRPDTW